MGDGKLKMAVIAGASSALKYKEKHPRADDHEILQYVSREAGKIIEKIDED